MNPIAHRMACAVRIMSRLTWGADEVEGGSCGKPSPEITPDEFEKGGEDEEGTSVPSSVWRHQGSRVARSHARLPMLPERQVCLLCCLTTKPDPSSPSML